MMSSWGRLLVLCKTSRQAVQYLGSNRMDVDNERSQYDLFLGRASIGICCIGTHWNAKPIYCEYRVGPKGLSHCDYHFNCSIF